MPVTTGFHWTDIVSSYNKRPITNRAFVIICQFINEKVIDQLNTI